jgi:hypothetical protein
VRVTSDAEARLLTDINDSTRPVARSIAIYQRPAESIAASLCGTTRSVARGTHMYVFAFASIGGRQLCDMITINIAVPRVIVRRK